MARIALVNPQIATSSWRAPIMRDWNDAAIRHGLASLSACLKAKGHTVSLIDLRCLDGWEDYQETLRRLAPDCVGVTAHTCEHDIALRCCELAKGVSRGMVTIAGGMQATMFPNAFLETGSVDYVLKGEGEVSFPKWVEDPHAFPAVFQGETPDLDQVPFADRTIWEDYAARIEYPCFGRFLPVPIIDIIAQRGCPWQCKFCCGPGEQNLYTKTVGGRVFPAVRSRGVQNVMQELSELYDRHRFRGIVFHDDQFLIQPRWAEEFATAMHTWGFVGKKVKFWCAIRADMVIRYESVVRNLRGAGLEILSMGFESFSDRMLKWMNKGTTRAQNIEAARIAKGLGIKLYGNVILGMPYADGKWRIEDDLETLAALDEIVKPEICAMSFFTPVPGSPFYDWCETSGLMITGAYGTTGQRGVGAARLKGVDYDRLNGLIAKRRRVPLVAGDRVKNALVKLGLIDRARRLKYALQGFMGGAV